MTDKLAEAIAFWDHPPERGPMFQAIYEAARSYAALPVVDVEGLKEGFIDFITSGEKNDNIDAAIRHLFDHLRATYPDGVRFLK